MRLRWRPWPRKEPEKKEKEYPYRAELGSGWTPGQHAGFSLPDWTRNPVEDIGDGERRHVVPKRRI
jgi:hypothetical protein